MQGPSAGLSLAVVKGRDTLVMKGYGSANVELDVPATERTVHRIGSVAKQFTSAAVMQLVEQGKLRLDDTLGALLPQVPAHWRPITLRQLMNHTSGIPSYTDFPRLRAYFATGLPRDSMIARLRGDSLMFAPGTGFYYNNTAYYLLGMIIEKVAGRPYAEHLRERVLAPLGLASTTYCATGPILKGRASGYAVANGALVNADYIDMDIPYAAGALCSTVGDLVAWTQALASGRVVSPASYQAMTTPVALKSVRPMTYGFGLGRDTLGGRRVVQHGGGIPGFSAHLTHMPDDSLVVAVLANSASTPSSELAVNIARVVIGLPLQRGPAPLADLPTTAAERSALVGRYRVAQPDGTREDAEVLEENGQLMLRLGGRPALRLQRQQGQVFAPAGQPGVRVRFETAGNGRATGFLIDRASRPLPATRVD
jgi:CubicO group peptidase (beta-lactamase class C family)